MFFLDQFGLRDIRQWSSRGTELRAYAWDFYFALARQRASVFDELKRSLVRAATPFEFHGWQRIIDFRYSSHPLSATGSLTAPGGRFNVGEIDPINFPMFPALYLAEDFATAFRERFGIAPTDEMAGLSADDLALTRRGSLSAVLVDGTMQLALDLRAKSTLREFISLTLEFKVPRSLRNRAKQLKIPPQDVVRDVDGLYETINNPEWRGAPLWAGVPANSQILGQIAHAAGIEAIVCPSVRGDGACIAVFPDNVQPGTCIELAGARPATVTHWRLDHATKDKFR